jgi:hypothetical protein
MDVVTGGRKWPINTNLQLKSCHDGIIGFWTKIGQQKRLNQKYNVCSIMLFTLEGGSDFINIESSN